MWTFPVHAFLTSLSPNLSVHANFFENLGLDTLGRLITVAAWSDKDLLSAIMGPKALSRLHRYVLGRELKTVVLRLGQVDWLRSYYIPSILQRVEGKAPLVKPAMRIPLNVASFASLDIDLSTHAPLLVERGISTLEDVAELGSWSPKDLRFMLRDVAPELTVLERFVFAHSIKSSTPDGRFQKGSMRVCDVLALCCHVY